VKKHVKKGKNVSMGFGFVEFDSVETATGVCKDLQVTPIPPLLFSFFRLFPLDAHIDVQHAKCFFGS
jgi:multiple RNA-binding domain-containing protein 1